MHPAVAYFAPPTIMPFTHSYSASAVAARGTRPDRASSNPSGTGIHILNSDDSSIDLSSPRYPSSAQSAPTTQSYTVSEHESSARSRLFSSGRKSPVPFRRFRRLSSSNSLNIATAPPVLDPSQSFDSQQSRRDSPAIERADTQIPPYPATAQRPTSIAPLHTLRTPPPPLPSSSTKPVFHRPKRTKSSSISILSTGLGLRSRDTTHLDPAPDPDLRRRHRKSASLSGSDADFSSSTLDSRRAVTSQPMLRAASPSPSLSESLYSSPHEATSRARAVPSDPSSHKSKQHKQAWYQAQQKTIELDNPYNRGGAQHSDSNRAKLFPLNVAVPDSVAQRGHTSPTHSRSPQPVVETFLSEEEMLAAGIHIIRRRDNGDATQASPSSKDSPGLATPRLHDHATMPTMPPRLYGSDHPDFLEFIDSPVDVKQSGPLIEQLVDSPDASASMQRALSHSRNKSSTGSLSISSASSTDYLPHSASNHDDGLSLHNGSTASLSSGSKHSFSFAKLRRAGSKQSNVAGSSRPSTANSSSEDISSSRHFLFPSRSHITPQEQQQSQTQAQAPQHHAVSSNGVAGVPGYLTPGPGSSASPFLNKHSATVGRASRSMGTGSAAKNGLAQVFHASSSGAATVGPSSSAANPYHAAAGNAVPPPKPPKPKPSLLAAFPRSGASSNSILGSISAPTTANSSDNVPLNNTLQPPGSAGTNNGFYRNIAHSRSQEAVAEARLDAEALRASAGTPLPPPRRLNGARGTYGSGASGGAYSHHSSAAMGRTISGSSGAGGSVVGALGHVGQLGAAVGRRGWDFMKTLQSSNNASGVVAASGRGGGAGYRAVGSYNAAAPVAAENESTRQWLMLLDGSDSGTGRVLSGCVFGAPLKDAVLRSRLSSIASEQLQASHDDDHLGVPDFGKQFSANFLESPRVTPRASVAAEAKNEPLSKEEARHLFLPRIVVRCIESLEKWGPSEEGIYRISGRSSHTSKLRSYFADPRNDLRLVEINPADLDINSVCSLLKSYLRELPEPLIPLVQSHALDQAVARLLAHTDDASAPVAGGAREAGGGASGSGAKITEARAASIDPVKAAEALGPLMRQLPIYNWYLLRELTHHLGMLAQPDIVVRTKMPISNLTLVLAPTVSISLPLLQVLVCHREVIFAGPAPGEDVAAVAAASVAAVDASATASPELQQPQRQQQHQQHQQHQQLAQHPKRPQASPKPAKPEKLGSPASRLPVMVRKRASSMGLGALLSSPTRKTAASAEEVPRRQHRRTPSATPSIELPAYLAEAAASRPASPGTSAASPCASAHEPYERPSTSLGHFAELSPSRPLHSTHSRDRFGGSRDAALRFNALALDDDKDHLQQWRTSSGTDSTPIARYYARMREEAEQRQRDERTGKDADEQDRDGAKTPLALAALSTLSSIPRSRYMADTTALPDRADTAIATGQSHGPSRSGRTSALDRPRPPTSSSASFFSGRSRRQDSVNGLNAFSPGSMGKMGGGGGGGGGGDQAVEDCQACACGEWCGWGRGG